VARGAGPAGDEDVEGAADEGAVELVLDRGLDVEQLGEAAVGDVGGDVGVEAGGGGEGAGGVLEGVDGGEAGLLDEVEGGLVVSVSPGKPTIRSVERARSGRVWRRRVTRSRYSETV
jgi:hypothetical protein